MQIRIVMNSLSVREKQVAGLLILGETEKEISEDLYISLDTVHTHKKNIFRKLGVKRVVDVARVLIGEIVELDIADLIRKEIVGPDIRKFRFMLIFLFLQIMAINSGMDERMIRIQTRTTICRTIRCRKNE